MLTRDEALRDVRGFAAAGRVRFTRHARERIEQRCDGRAGHVMHALANASTCAEGERGTWRVTGPDLDDDELTCVVTLEDGVIVVTVF